MPGTAIPVRADPPMARYTDVACGWDTIAAFNHADEHPTESAAAIAICHQCKHRQECLEWALEHPQTGVWGGLTANQRERLKKSRETT